MTKEHILYIPIVFSLGFIMGSLITAKYSNRKAHDNPFSHELTMQARKAVSLKQVLVTFLVFIAVFVITHVFDIPLGAAAVSKALGGSELFDKRPSYTSHEVFKRISAFSPEGLSMYKRFTYSMDVLFPLSFFSFLYALAGFAKTVPSLSKTWSKILVSLPILWLMTDLLENTIIYHLLSLYPDRNNFLAGALGFITTAKFSFLLLSILIPSIMITVKKLRFSVTNPCSSEYTNYGPW